MQGSGVGSQIVGGFVTLGIGVVVIAAIYQLSQNNAPLVSAGSTDYTQTLSSLFK